MAPSDVDLLQGTVDVLILRALAWEPLHGYAISRWIRDRSDGVLAVEGAALYQALHRLERKRWISPQWGVSENNRRAKYYRLTAKGQQQLAAESAAWKTYAAAVTRVLAPSPA
ncbi:MAG TPA: PadR family transcriptional regulator [Gemmatimonadaceae bacterium]|nr:PadR family transcriptional regulator [Gemmatimonadaceae bacterium]